jgi:hypothetical protein
MVSSLPNNSDINTDSVKGTNGATIDGRLPIILDKHTIHGQGPSGPE